MEIRNIFKEMLPPAVLRIARSVIASNRTYGSYEDALRNSSSGYEDQYLVRTIFEETKEYIDQLESAENVIADITLVNSLIPFSFFKDRSTLNVIDLGGSCGIHYFTIRKLLGHKFSFRWHIAETQALVAIARELENEELKFFTGVKEAAENLDRTDLVISSGAIQYMKDPRKALHEMTDTGAEYILLTRLSLSVTGRDIITVQKSLLSQNSFEKLPAGYSDRIIKYPHTNMKESDFLDIVLSKYRIILHIPDNSGLHNFDRKCKGYGVLLQKI